MKYYYEPNDKWYDTKQELVDAWNVDFEGTHSSKATIDSWTEEQWNTIWKPSMKTPEEEALEIAKEMIPYVETWDYRWDEPNYEFNDLKAALVAVNKLVEFTKHSEFWLEAREFLLNEIERRAKLYKDDLENKI